jgi:hypothetical protein
VQYSCKTKLRSDGQAEVHVSSGEESEAVTKEEDESEDESEDEFVTERKEPDAEVGGAGRGQGCVGAVLQATKAGSWWFRLV